MICPNCGEPVQTRHLFCVVCGADLKDVKPEKAGVRLKNALTKPIVVKKTPAKAEKQAETEPACERRSAEPDPVSFPDFMHNFT